MYIFGVSEAQAKQFITYKNKIIKVYHTILGSKVYKELLRSACYQGDALWPSLTCIKFS